MQQGMGEFAAVVAAMGTTPGSTRQPSPALALPSPTAGAVPSGPTPNAKRPITVDAIQIAQGGSRVLSQEYLSAGFDNLTKLQQRDATLMQSVVKAVE